MRLSGSTVALALECLEIFGVEVGEGRWDSVLRWQPVLSTATGNCQIRALHNICRQIRDGRKDLPGVWRPLALRWAPFSVPVAALRAEATVGKELAWLVWPGDDIASLSMGKSWGSCQNGVKWGSFPGDRKTLGFVCFCCRSLPGKASWECIKFPWK